VSLRLALLLALLSGLLVAYLTALNPGGVPVTLAGGSAYDPPLLPVIVGTLLVGTTFGFVLGILRDAGRSYQDRRRARHAHGADTLGEPSRPEVQAQAPGAEERIETLLAVARDHQALGRTDDALQMYRRVLARGHDHVAALRGLRDLMAEHGRWREALATQERLIRIIPREGRAAEEAWRAGIQYELGRALLAAGDQSGAVSRWREALRARPDFLPAALALGDAHVKAGEAREARRVWERALETEPIPPLLSRVGQLYRADGRPARMIALYQDAALRHPEDLATAFGLGRAYFELAMLDEAAEQFQKLEAQAPDLSSIHAYLGAILERHGHIGEALEEYRRALRFPESFEWPHHCVACGAAHPSWLDRCPSCRLWNTSRP
jgi:tetratricopeptide (TPR) repeat protein